MASAGTYRRFDRWLAGDATDRVFDIGTICETNRDRPVGLGLLRVGYYGSATLAAIDGYIKIADDGTEMGPIDVPFSIVVEEPVHVTLRPVAAPGAEVRVVLSVTPVCAHLQCENATRTIAAALGAVLILPQWVRQVTAFAPATFQFRDRVGAVLSNAITGAFVRPAAAYDVLVGAAGTIVFSY